MKTPMKAKLVVKPKALKVKAAPTKTAAAKATPAKAAAAAGTVVKTPTVTLSHLAKDLAETHQLPKKQAATILADLTALISKHLKKGSRIRINTIGILQVRKRPARMGRNPATGEAIKIKASKKVAFRAAKELKESI